MVAYGAMLALALAALGARRMWIALAVLALIADAIENLALFDIDIDAPGSWLSVLIVASRAKFVLLGVASAAIAVHTWRREPGRWRWLALAHAPALPVALAGVAAQPIAGWLMPAFAVSWLAVVVWSALSRGGTS